MDKVFRSKAMGSIMARSEKILKRDWTQKCAYEIKLVSHCTLRNSKVSDVMNNDRHQMTLSCLYSLLKYT